MSSYPKKSDAPASFSSSSFFVPVLDGKIDDNVRISKTGIVFSSKDQSQYDFPYDQVYTNRQEFIRYAYSTSVSPLVQNAIQGESVMMVFGGVPSSDINQYLLSSPAPSTPQSGLICQAADEMLSAIPRPEGNEKIGSVTFSWYRIDTNTSELLTDVLKAASAKTNVPSNDTASSLVLREAGKGRGMVVPGVWEVEIANGSDIEAVVAHVSKVIPQVADHSNGSAHTVMSLTMNLKNVPPPPAGIQSPSAISADNPGVGRISFLLLSQLNSPPGKATTASTSTSSRYAWVEQLEAISQWVDSRHSSPPFHKSRLMLLIKDAFLRRQKSAFMLLLQPLANPAVSYLNFQWLKIGKLFCRDSPKIPFPGEDEMKTLQSNTQANSMTSNNMKRVPSQSKLADQQQPSKERSGSNGRGSRSSTPVNGNTTNVTAPPSQPQQHSSNRSSRTSSRDEFDYTSLQQAGEFNEPKVAEYIPPPPPHHFSSQIQGHTNSRPPSRNSSPPIYNNPTMQATGNASTPDHYKTATEPPNYLYDDSYMDSSPMPRQFPSRQNSSNSQAPGIAPQHQQPQHYAQSMSAAQPTLPNNNANTNWNNNNNNNQPRFAQTSNAALGMNRAAPQPVAGLQHTMPIPQPNNPPKRASSAPRGSNVAAVNSNVIPVPIHNNNNNNYISGGNSVAGDSVGFSYLEDMGYHENEASLTVALEASRAECSALRVAYNYANDRYGETKNAYDNLIGQLKEEGSMLSKRDRERYKNAMKDLKDYAIYKEVMEAAMVRLQNELEKIADENKELKVAKVQEERVMLKQKSSSDKYNRELHNSKKRIDELEAKLQKMEKANKSLLKERDTAVHSLAHAQSTGVQKATQFQEMNTMKQKEIDELHRKLKHAEERVKSLEADKEAILAANTTEVANLRSAHSKALETLMSYQEENDVLRSAVMELSAAQQQTSQGHDDEDDYDNYKYRNNDNDDVVDSKLSSRKSSYNSYQAPSEAQGGNVSSNHSSRRNSRNNSMNSEAPLPPPPSHGGIAMLEDDDEPSPQTTHNHNGGAKSASLLQLQSKQVVSKRVEDIIGKKSSTASSSAHQHALPPAISNIVNKKNRQSINHGSSHN